MKLKRFLSENLSLGKGSIQISSAMEKYRAQYEGIEKKRKFRSEAYRLVNGNAIVWVKVPSESLDDFYYDVLLELETAGSNDYEDCHIKIFSNSPSFVYSYAYVFYHLDDDEKKSQGMIIDKFNEKIPKNNLLATKSENKLEPEILKGKPVIRNPYGLPLFDKTVYYAIFHMMNKYKFSSIARNNKLHTLLAIHKQVLDFDTLMIHRESMAKRQKTTKKYEEIAKSPKNALKEHEKQNKKNSIGTGMVNVISQSTSKGVNKVTASTSKNVHTIKARRK